MNGTLNALLRGGLYKTVLLLALLGVLPRQATAQVGLPPIILVQPLDVVVLKGISLDLTVLVSSLTTVSYKWYKDGTIIPDGTNATYSIPATTTGDAGSYYVEARNSSGATLSRTASVIVLLANDVPQVVGDDYSTAEDTRLTVPARGVLANDSDLFGSPLEAILVSGTTNGALTLNTDGSFSYLAATNFNGADSFTYVAWDGQSTAQEQNDTGTRAQVVQKGQPGSQSFQHGATGDADYWIRHVKLYVSREVTAPDTNWTVSIGTGINTGALPGGTVSLNPLTITNTSSGTSFQPYEIIFSQPVGPLTAGNKYYLNIGNEAPNTMDLMMAWPDADVYANGTYYQAGVDSSKDIRFVLSDLVVSAVARVTINVTPVNDSPIALADSATVAEDNWVTIDVLSNDIDPEGAPLRISAINTTNGVATTNANDPNVILFRPSTNYFGTVVLNYTVSDGTNTASASVSVAVTAVNDAPIAMNDSTNTLEDVAVTIKVLANDIDPDNTLSITNVTTTNGTAVVNGTNILFTPATNFSGMLVFNYTITDGTSFATGLVTVAVTAVNDPPIARNDSTNTLEDTSVYIKVLLNDTDAEGTRLIITNIVTTNGTAFASGTNIIFTPSTNYFGTVVLNYTVSDGTNTASASVNVAVTAVNDAPIAMNDSTNVVEDMTVTIRALANDYDVEGTALTLTGVDATNGSAVMSGTNIVFTPGTNFNGTVVLTYTVSDGALSSTGKVTVTVTPVNDAPVAVNDTVTTPEDTAVIIPVLVNDSDVESSLILTNVSTTNGVALIIGTNVVFTPATNFNGSVVLSYTISDGTLSATGKVTVTVSPVNDAPIVVNDSTNTVEDVSVTIRVLANDSDVERSTLTLTGATTTNGTAVLSGTNVVFTPATNFNGTVVFNYTVSDGALVSTGRVTVTVSAVNDAPVAVNDTATTAEDTSVTIPVLANDVDVDGPALSITSVTPTNGTAVISGTSIVFRPATNFNGTAVFNYAISDGSLSATGSITVTVTAVNDAPIARADVTNTVEDVSVTIAVLANDSDVEGSPLTVATVFATNGTVVISGTNVVFTPATNFNGTTYVAYVVSDGDLSSTGLVTIFVTPMYDAPVAIDDAFTIAEDATTTFRVLTNDYNPDGRALAIVSVTTTNGTAAIAGTNIVFTPALNYFGTLLLSYAMTDGTSSSTGLVTVTVTSVNDVPVANGESYVASEGTPLPVPAPGVLGNDYDVEGSALLTAVLATAPAHGLLVLNANGSFTYTPDSNYFGADSFAYKASDGSAQSASTTVSLWVTLTNQLNLALASVASNGLRVQLIGPAPAVYTLLASSNNVVWTPISTNVALDGFVEFVDTNGFKNAMSFYQGRVGSQATTVLEGNSSGNNKVDIRETKKGAQSFRHGTAGDASYSISKIVLSLSRSGTLPNAPLNFAVGTSINGGTIAGSAVVIAPATITNSSSGGSFQTYEIIYDHPVVLNAGTTYYLNFDCEAPNSGRIYFESSGFSSAYSSGTFYRNGSNLGEDAVFEIWGQ